MHSYVYIYPPKNVDNVDNPLHFQGSSTEYGVFSPHDPQRNTTRCGYPGLWICCGQRPPKKQHAHMHTLFSISSIFFLSILILRTFFLFLSRSLHRSDHASFLSTSFSPISTTFPAPIVIRISPSLQFALTKASISSKDGK